MAGIAGIARAAADGVNAEVLWRMAAALRHRGPDGCGWYGDPRVGLVQLRLGVFERGEGGQPIGNASGRIVAVLDGEIYNIVELRRELQALGYHFASRDDAELLVHGYEAWGRGLLDRLNGQFAFVLYDQRDDSLLLARDRFGVAPLYYADRRGDLYFASEAKALFASGEVEATPDLRGLDEIFTFWAVRAPRTPFLGVEQLEPGCWARWRAGRLVLGRYYRLDFAEAAAEPHTAVTRLDALLRDGVELRLRADLPKGGYLSGGLDSSITCTLAAAATPAPLRTFSVAFADPMLDESGFQQLVAGQIASRHEVEPIRPKDVGEIFPEVIRHTETPLVRTAPAPFFLLARRARAAGVRVVLSGEGADELFLGYDLFKETLVRRFCLRQPHSTWRPRLFDRLYPYLGPAYRGGEFWRHSFLEAGHADDPLFSHLTRFGLTAQIKEFYSGEFRAALAGADPLQQLRDALPTGFGRWSALNRAAYLELAILLPSYLLSSQGERMTAAHGLVARYPFLDHRLFEFAAALPGQSKLRGLREKEILRRWAARILPPAVTTRPKQPYRAPDIPAFFGGKPLPYVAELLEPAALRATGFFQPEAVAGLVRRCHAGRATGFRENQALVAILSTQLWHGAHFGRGAADRPTSYGQSEIVFHEWLGRSAVSGPTRTSKVILTPECQL
jgi:asparagine synthase (glutamine-hydrolysing)